MMTMATAPQDCPTVGVWSPYVRIFHWALVACVAVAWFSSEEVRRLHEYAGYAAAALLAWRLVAGFLGSHYTRFGQFVRGPAAVLRYLRDISEGREHRYLGHNPAGGAMVVALLACLAGIAITGWMQTTDTFWGVEWVESAHRMLGNGILPLIGLHVVGVLIASIRHRESLVWAMIDGRKREAQGGVVS
jgi:cytochrome b